MRAKLTFLSALAVSLVGGVLATGCQTYDFEPVEPLAVAQTTESRSIKARAPKPNLMLLVDTSGSMKEPAEPSLAVCKNSNGQSCGESTFQCNIAGGCDTRWSALQKAMTDFLRGTATNVRIGLTTYPKDDFCGASSAVRTTLPAEDLEDTATLTGKADEALNTLLAIKTYATATGDKTPEGGTPTAESLKFAGLQLVNHRTQQKVERSDFVLLLTDGLPNCNETYPSPAGTPNSTCFCTLSNGCNFTPRTGCLDKDASVAAVQQLRAQNIKTIVIGFGADFSSGNESGRRGAETLNAMAIAGDFNRTCAANADCGAGDTCNTSTGLCNRRFYQAGNKDELLSALRQISEKVGDKPCLLKFTDPAQAPTSAELVVVYINGERLAAGSDTWGLLPDKSGLEFLGSTCTRIENSSTANPAEIEVRAVQAR
jgi:hypothetical protein